MDINHIANLARLGLKEEELKKLEADLLAILGFVEKLKEVDIKGIEPMAGGTDLNSVMRDDEVGEKNEKQRKIILDNAPKINKGNIEVRAVFE
ncbi:MAG: Aspartyl/glutamyl-tRNA(Asn/Gln) amidotransferase subunit C [Parcubacteria group bacterium GW2011_GWF2_39_13b]|nr:MAG: Aspartyl/glutamyl-tRNA(Asn/Gln) amidotransferase subunit C [Parcubacteria group bacterium GW2011_GWF2_39_13b]